MNRRMVVAVGVVALLLIGGITWWLGSPLFLDRTVHEVFPTIDDMSDEAMVDAMTDEARMDVDPAELAANPDMLMTMTEEELMAVADEVMEAAAAMPTTEVMDMMPEADEPILLLTGMFTGEDEFHRGSGNATLYQLPDGSYLLRFEDFEVINGPDLHVFLSTVTDPSSHDEVVNMGGLNLGRLKGNIGDQNYTISAGTDVNQFKSVVIYCLAFQHFFATAPLN